MDEIPLALLLSLRRPCERGNTPMMACPNDSGGLLHGTTNRRITALGGVFAHVSLKAGTVLYRDMSTLSDGLRQSDRVSLRMPVEAAWATAQGATFTPPLRLTNRVSTVCVNVAPC